MFVHKTFLGTGIHVYTYTHIHCLLISQGEEGAKQVLQMLKEEFRLAMALTGGTATFPLRNHIFSELSFAPGKRL